MSDDRKYVRVYYNDMIRDYPGVWEDDAQLATWLRMLSTADPMWPTAPELPRSVRSRVLARLVESTLVDALAGHRFRIKGLDAERKSRSDAGRNAAAMRWHSERISAPDAPAMPKRVRAETSRDETSNGAPASDDRDSLDTYHELTLYRPWGLWSGDKLKAAINDYGDPLVDAALREEATLNADRKTLLDRTLARLSRNADRAREVRKTKPRLVEPPGDPEERKRIINEARIVRPAS